MYVDALVHYKEECRVIRHDLSKQKNINSYTLKKTQKAYSMHVESSENIIITDNLNDCLVTVNNFETEQIHTWPSVKRPFGLTTFSSGIVCVSCHGTIPSSSGVVVLSDKTLND